VPWNYPLMMTTWKLAPALAAGCTVVLKPDSATPLSALRMAELATEVGFPPASINVVPGPGRPSAPPRQHPGVDKVAFTGSTRRARDHAARLRRDQAPHPRARRQEPEPRLRRRDLDDAIPSSVWSIYYSAGQSCEARSRVLVEQSLYDDFVVAVREAASSSRSATRSTPRRRSAR
jgi:acyl-CoA reductase-like NAD-dependent aldehyde dehydrogenase